ncbi:hypothetical protein P3T73_08545 [Kiritimatiellota bacterium B12222]|nr:hypothetical protein P3T73_08545 [Kiritimatiellota bacterium B12222]
MKYSHTFKSLFSLWILLGLMASSVQADKLSLTVVDKGVEIDAGSTGKFIIGAPPLTLENGKTEKATFTVNSKSSGEATYPCGAELKLQIKGDEIQYEYDIPDNGKSFMFDMLIPIKFNQGGEYALGKSELQEFPEEHQGQFLTQGNGKSAFTLLNAKGKGFSLETQGHWQALQDNREFDWPIFVYKVLVDLKAAQGKDIIITITSR